MTILSKQSASVSDRGSLVVLRLGAFERAFEFDLALKVATALVIEGRYAKRCAGDESRHFTCQGVLHNATPDEVPRASRFGRALPQLLAARDISVKQQGQMVALRIGRTTADLPYADAMKIGRWMRLHGKLARNHAGERAHWSEIARLPVIENREQAW